MVNLLQNRIRNITEEFRRGTFTQRCSQLSFGILCLFLLECSITGGGRYWEVGPVSIRILGNGENVLSPLTDKERDWFLSFLDDEHVVRMSEGVIEGDKVTVTRGPLMGFEGDICKIDRHKRRACIKVSLFGRTVPASVGLEIVRKTA